MEKWSVLLLGGPNPERLRRDGEILIHVFSRVRKIYERKHVRCIIVCIYNVCSR